MKCKFHALCKKFKGIQVRETLFGKEFTEAMNEPQKISPKFSTKERFYCSKDISEDRRAPKTSERIPYCERNNDFAIYYCYLPLPMLHLLQL